MTFHLIWRQYLTDFVTLIYGAQYSTGISCLSVHVGAKMQYFVEKITFELLAVKPKPAGYGSHMLIPLF